MKVWVHKGPNNELPRSKAQIATWIEEANDIYQANGVPISFVYDCNLMQEINNSPHYVLNSESEESPMFGNYYTANHFNLHLVNEGYGPAGSANGTPSQKCWIEAEVNTFDLAHEFGHNLGLLHTHNSKFPCLNDNNDFCADCWQEPVSRTRKQPIWCWDGAGKKKCEINGDGLCDTAGEPKLTQNIILPNCTIDSYSMGTDNWGQTWTPDQYNIMSYAVNGADCRDFLSAGQAAIMLSNVPNYALTSNPTTTVGPISLCNSGYGTYSVSNVPSGSTVSWTKSSNLSYISGQNTNSYRIRVPSSGKGSGWVRATIYNSCGYKDVDKLSIWYGAPTLHYSGNSGPCMDPHIQYTAESNSGVSYNWNFTASKQGLLFQSYGNKATISPGTIADGTSISYTISVSSATCSQSTSINGSYYKPTTCDCSSCDDPDGIPGEFIVMYPNPVEDEVLIESPDRGEFEVWIYDASNEVVFHGYASLGQLRKKVVGMRRGLYYVVVQIGSKTIRKRLVIKN